MWRRAGILAAAAAASLLALTLTGCGLLPEPPGSAPAPPGGSPPATSPGAAASLSPDGLSQVERAAIRVRNIACAGIGSGSGFALDEHLLVTNGHVIEGAATLQLNTYDGRDIEVGTSAAATFADLAIVRTTQALPAAVPIATTDPKVGDRISIVGYPGGGPLRTSQGAVLAYTDDALGANVDQVFATDAYVEPGSSGSAVLDQDGAVVGVVYARGDNGWSYAVPVSVLRALLDQPDLFVPLARCG